MLKSPAASRIYTLPNCNNCEILKSWLKEHKVNFEEKLFDTDTQLELLMRNIFGNPPILEVGSKILSSEELFLSEVLDEKRLWEVLNSEE